MMHIICITLASAHTVGAMSLLEVPELFNYKWEAIQPYHSLKEYVITPITNSWHLQSITRGKGIVVLISPTE